MLIAAQPFIGPNGEVYVAWNDYAANTIAFNRSLDGGATFGTPSVISSKRLPFDIAIPAISLRAALVYLPAQELIFPANCGSFVLSEKDPKDDAVHSRSSL